MNTDELFLQKITDNPADNLTRLIYADWLEERGDLRARFLRLQQAFAEQSPGTPLFRDLCGQEQELVRQLDPLWLQRVRRYTTAPPCRNLADLVPELRPYARTTTRLHPHRAAGPLPLSVSKFGGWFLWPESEPWPGCLECGVDLAPQLQLRSRDLPNVEFPAGTDLMQLFCCPDRVAHGHQPALQVWWRAAADVTKARLDEPDLSGFPERSEWVGGYIPFECAVYPEAVVEYPIGDDLIYLAGSEQALLISELVEKMDLGPVDDLAEQFGSEYGPGNASELALYELGQCPGSKVGGKPGFRRNGLQFDHLLTLATWEFDSASFHRWVAVEDQRLLASPGETLSWVRLQRSTDFLSLQRALGMQFGRTQRMHLYVCRDQQPWSIHIDVGD